jgi:hypothetical protein
MQGEVAAGGEAAAALMGHCQLKATVLGAIFMEIELR